jgi:hypothetical protein
VAVVPSSAQVVAQEVCCQPQVPSQVLTQSQLAQVGQQVAMEETVEILCLILLLRSVVVVAAPHSMRAHQVAAAVAVDIAKMVAQVRQAKALLAETMQQVVVQAVVVLDQQV